MLKDAMKISKVRLLTLLVIVLLAISPISAFAAPNDAREVENAQLYIYGKEVKLISPLHIVQGRLYMPVSQLATLLSASIDWNGATQETTIITKSNDEVVLGNEVPTVYYNQERYKLEDAPYMYEGRMYAPVRSMSEILHATVEWDAEQKRLTLVSVPLQEINEENPIETLAEQFSLTAKQLLAHNEIPSIHKAESGTKVRVIIPSILENKAETYTDAEFKLLAKLVMVESGYESYEGQLAVANVILNRVNNSKFPSTINDVIYSGKQFPPAHNGKLDKSVPNASVKRATKDALNGKNIVGEAVYFHNPKRSKGSFWSSLTTEAIIGNHRFAK